MKKVCALLELFVSMLLSQKFLPQCAVGAALL